MAGTLGNLLMFRRHRTATAGHAGHGPGTPRPAATCCPAEQPMPAAGRNRVGNAGVVADLPTTPSKGSLSLSSVQKCDSDRAGPEGRRRSVGPSCSHSPEMGKKLSDSGDPAGPYVRAIRTGRFLWV